MQLIIAGLFGLAALAFAPTMAGAEGSGAWGHFTLHNQSSSYTIDGFYTNEGDGWSSNWMSVQLAAGDSVDMEFNNKSGPCTAQFKVSWVGTGNSVVEDWQADFCKITNLYMLDTGATFD